MKKESLSIAMILVALTAVAIIIFFQIQNVARRQIQKLTGGDVAAAAPAPGRAAAAGGAIAWQYDLSYALDLARADKKVVVVDVYTDWCGWCKKMDESIYTDPLVVGLSQQEVFLKIDAEDGGEGTRFARKMGVKGYPTTVVLDGSGRALNMVAGYISTPERFVNFVESAKARQTRTF